MSDKSVEVQRQNPTLNAENLSRAPGVKRRTFLGRLGGGIAAGFGLFALSGTRNATAQSSEGSGQESDEVSKLMALAESKKAIVKQLLYTPPGEAPQDITVRYVKKSETSVSVTHGIRDLKNDSIRKTIQNPQLNIEYSSANSEPDRRMSLEICRALGELVWESNKELLERDFYEIMDRNLGINFDQIALARADASQMAKLEELGNLVDFAKYTEGTSTKTIYSHRERTLLPKELFTRIFSIWLNESAQLEQKLVDKPEIASVFLESLQLILKRAPEGAALHSFGIDKNNALKVIKSSGHAENYKDITQRAA